MSIDFSVDPDDMDNVPEVDDPEQKVKLTETCGTCGRRFPGSDRNGGHCMTCHLSFASQTGAEKHRVGKFENRAVGQANTRRCLTVEELADKGWTVDEHFVVRMPPPKNNPWKKNNREETE